MLRRLHFLLLMICIVSGASANYYHFGKSQAAVAAPTQITFTILNTCSSGDTYNFFLNGTSIGSVGANPSGGCTCAAALQTFTVNNAALLTGAWSPNGPNSLRVQKTSSSTLFAWVSAQLTFATGTSRAYYDYNGGDATETNLCSAQYSGSAFDQVLTPATPIYYRDADGDGYGDPNIILQGDNSLSPVTATTPTGYVTTGGDCDDANPNVPSHTPCPCKPFANTAPGLGFTQELVASLPNITTTTGYGFDSHGNVYTVDYYTGNLFKVDLSTTVPAPGGIGTVHPVSNLGLLTYRTGPKTGQTINGGYNFTQYPDGTVYFNSNIGVVRVDLETATITSDPLTGSPWGIVVDPQLNSHGHHSIITAGGYVIDPVDNRNLGYCGISGDGIAIDATGNFIFAAGGMQVYKRVLPNPASDVPVFTLVNNYGGSPDGMAFGVVGTDQVVVSNDGGSGTVTMWKFPNNDFTKAPTATVIASKPIGGEYGDQANVGPDGYFYITYWNGTIFPDCSTSSNASIVRFGPAGRFLPPTHSDNISLTPATDTKNVGTNVVLTATQVTTDLSTNQTVPVANTSVTFTVVGGPEVGQTFTGTTDVNGKITFTLVNQNGVGDDVVHAQFVDANHNTQTSNNAVISFVTPPCTTPVFTSCPGNQTANTLSNTCNNTVTYSSTESVTGSPAPIVTYALTGATSGSGNGNGSGSVFNKGITTVTLTATNSCGTATCTFTVTVTDNQPPVITTNGNQNVNAEQGKCGASVSVSASATDNCSVGTPSGVRSDGLALSGLYPVGSTTITWNVTDGNGNPAAPVTQTVTVTDNELPKIIVSANQTLPNTAGDCGAMVTIAPPVVSDNCQVQSVTNSYNGTGDASGHFNLGPTTITWTVTDIHGNVNTATQTITVNDNEPPTIVCPQTQTLNLDANCSAALPDYRSLLTATDNCTAANALVITQSPAAGTSVSTKGAIIITFTVTDASNNSSTCTITVDKKDVTAPVINCPAPITVNNNTNVCGAVVTFATPTATDNCSGSAFNFWNAGEPNQAGSEDFLQFYNSGTWNDLNGGNNLNFIVEFNSIIATSFTNYNRLGTFGGHTYYQSTFVQTWQNARNAAIGLGGDLASINTLAEDQFLAPYGGNTWVGGYQDHSDPSYVEPGNASQNYGGWKWVDGTKLGAGQITITQIGGLASGSIFPIGPTTNIFKATDEAGNSSTCSFTVTVVDNQRPTINCAANITHTSDAGVCTYSFTPTAPSASDNCPGVTVAGVRSDALALNAPYPKGSTTITWTATDASSNTQTCTQTITVTDNQKPIIVCASAQTLNLDANCSAVLPDYRSLLTVSDNCTATNALVITQSPVAGTALNATGILTVTFTVTDASNNSNTCSIQVTKKDVTPPTIVCPQPITVNITPNQCSAVVTYSLPVATDNCAGSVATGVHVLNSGMQFFDYANGTYETQNSPGLPLTFNPTDGQKMAVFLQNCSSTHYMYQDVTISAGTSQLGFDMQYNNHYSSFSNQQFITVEIRNASTNALLQTIFKTNPGDPLTTPMTHYSFDVSAYAGQTIRLEIIDATINNLFFDVLLDNVTLTGSNLVNGSFETGDYTGWNIFSSNGSCGTWGIGTGLGVSIRQIAGLASGSSFPIGITTNTFEATDLAGNTSTCSFNVRVVDNQPPVIVCPGDMNVIATSVNGATVNYATPVGTDNCSGVTTALTTGLASGSTFPIGTTKVTYTATDAAGLTASCSFNVVVKGLVPVIVVPQNISVSNDAGQCGAVVNFAATESIAVPASTITYSIQPGSFFPIGTTNVTATATNAVGTSIGTFSVTVVDNQAPVIVCAAPVTVNNIVNTCAADVVIPAPVITDNCNIVTHTDDLDTYTLGNVSGQSPQWSPWPGGNSALVSAEQFFSAPYSLKVTGASTGGPVDQLFKIGNQTSGDWTLSFKMYVPAGNTGYYNLQKTETPGQEFAHQVYFKSNGSGTLNAAGTAISFTYPQGQWFEVKQLINQNTNQTSLYINGVFVKSWQYSLKNNGTAGLNKLGAFDFYPATSNATGTSPYVDVNPSATPLFYIDDISLTGDVSQIGTYISRRYSKNYPVGETQINIKVTDKAGNAANCIQTITVVDNQLPVITSNGDKSVFNDAGKCDAAVVVSASAADNCGVVAPTGVRSDNKPLSDPYPVGSTTITWTVTDIHANNAIPVSQTIIVTDNTIPVITTNGDKSVYNDAGKCGATVTVSASATDNCGVGAPSGVRSDALPLSNPYPVGTTTITWTVTDVHGNNAVPVTQTIEVTDNEKPVITSNGNKSVYNDPGKCGATVVVSASAADNCSVGAPAGLRSDALALTDLYPVGTTTISWTVTDIHGNIGIPVTQTIVVADNEKPVIACAPDVVFCANYGGVTTYTINPLTAGDNCAIQTTTYAVTGATTRSGSGNNASGVFAVGVSTITWTVTDTHGNVSVCSTKVTINPLPVASFVSSNADAFCNKTTLTASSNINPATYSWTSGSTPGSFIANADLVLGLTNADGIYKVFVKATNTGCISEFAASYNYQKQNLAGNYTILAYKEVELGKYNKVQTGSVGVMTAKGEAEFKSYTSVNGPGAFVKSPQIDKDGSGIVIPTQIIGLANVTLPTMQYNTANTNNLPSYTASVNNATLSGSYKNLTVKKGVSVTVTASTFGSIRLEEGASIRFSSAVLNIDNLSADRGAKNNDYTYIRFAPNTSVRMSGYVSFGSQVLVNPEANKVTFYMGDLRNDEEKFTVKGGDTKVIANIIMPDGKLRVTATDCDDDNHDSCDHKAHDARNCKHRGHDHNDCDHKAHSAASCNDDVYMTGLFIAEEVESKGNTVIWNSYDCSSPVPSYSVNAAGTATNATVESKEAGVTTEEELKITVMPNPSTTYFTLKLESKYATPVNMRVMDGRGRVIDAKSQIGSNSTIQIGHNYSSGTYYAELIQGTQRKVVQLIKAKG